MISFDLDKLTVRLAEEFKRRGMRRHVDDLRVWYRGYRARSRAALREKQPPWTEGLVLEWLCTLQVPPFDRVLPVLEHGERGCACDRKQVGDSAVACVFPGGLVLQCFACGARWLVRQG